MNELLCEIESIGIVPVISLKDAEKAGALAKALCEGGIPCAEVTSAPMTVWNRSEG